MKASWCGCLLSAALLLFLLSGCGAIDFSGSRALPEETPPGAPSESPPSTSAELKTATFRREIRRNLETEKYRAALNLLREEIGKGLPEAVLAEEYGRTINGLLAQGEDLLESGMPEKAGGLFRAALDGFPETESVAAKVNLTRPEIRQRIEECAGVLMERGLVAYRAGDLDSAITTWEAIQAFAPRHQASQKALETARVQRSNLERVSTPN